MHHLIRALWPTAAFGMGLILAGAAWSSPDRTATGAHASPTRSHAQALGQLQAARAGQPVPLEPNEGQADTSVAFVARALDYEVSLDRTGGLHARDSQGSVTGFSLAGGNPRPAIERGERLPGDVSYAATPRHPARVVPTFERVRYHAVYDGVNLLYHSTRGQLEYDFEVAPGARPDAIRMRFGKDESLRVDPATGDLVIARSDGAAIRHSRPQLFLGGAARTPVQGRYALLDAHTVGFEVGAYDHSRALIIDPTVIATQFIMGSGHDLPSALAVDSAGNVYITGITDSYRGFPNGNALIVTPFPTKDCTGNRGGLTCNYSAFLMKLSSSGTILKYTLWGGTAFTQPDAIVVDSRSVYISGGSTSSDISGNGAGNGARYDQATPAGGERAFAAKFDLTNLQPWSITTLGAAGLSEAHGLAVDAAQNMYITGSACGTGFPVSAQFQHPVQQGTFKGGVCDAFVAKIDTWGFLNSGYSTYLGGEGFDVGTAIAVDAAGSAWVTGQTCSRQFPLTNTRTDHGIAGAYNGCTAFVTALHANGLLQGSTLLGGHVWVDQGVYVGPYDQGTAITLNGSNGVYIAGYTASPNFYTDGGVLMYNMPCAPTSATQAACTSGFVALIDSGFNIDYSTYFGGSLSSEITSIGRNSRGEIYVGGFTNGWQGFPGAPQVTPNPSAGFLSKLSSGLNSTLWTQFQGAAVSGLAIQQSTTKLGSVIGTNIYTTGWRLPPAPTSGDAYEDGFMLKTNDPVTVVVSPICCIRPF